MTKKTNVDIDHIDPKWKEGRDYQLVCGLNVVYNMCERERTLNIQKQNRFLPWRVSKDDWGEVPVEQGDWCLFLNPDTGEWVLEEFMGSWWWEKSYMFTGTANRVITDETRAKMSEAQKRRAPPSAESRARMSASSKLYRHSDEAKEKIGAAHRGRKWSAEVRANMSAAAQRRPPPSAETRAKTSAALKGKPKPHRRKRKPMSEEERKMRSEAAKKRWAKQRDECDS